MPRLSKTYDPYFVVIKARQVLLDTMKRATLWISTGADQLDVAPVLGYK